MLSIRGVFKNGVARPIRPLKGREGQRVIITFLEEPATESVSEVTAQESDWAALQHLIEACTVETGIGDLALQHDHYLHHRSRNSLAET